MVRAAAARVESGGFLYSEDKPWLTVDRVRGTAFLVWTHSDIQNFGGNGQIVVARSTDRGTTWSAPIIATKENNEGSGQIGVVADGTVVLTDFDPTNERYVSRISHDGGATFEAPRVIAANVGIADRTSGTRTSSPRVQMLVARRGDLYCAFPSKNGVLFTASHDGGQTWSAPLRLGGANGDALLPAVAVDDATGNVVVSWLDGRDDPRNSTLRLYAARSTDGGATFSAPSAFSDPFPAGGWIGDYNAVASVNSALYVTGFSAAGGILSAARITVPSPSRHRAVNH